MRRSRGGFFENEERDGTDGQTDGQAGPGSIFAGHTRSPTASTKKRRKSSGDDVGRASVLLPPLHFTVGGIDVRRRGGGRGVGGLLPICLLELDWRQCRGLVVAGIKKIGQARSMIDLESSPF